LATSKRKKGSSKTDTQKELVEQAASDAAALPDESGEALKSDRMDDFLFHAANYMYIRRKLFITLAVIALVAISTSWGVFEYVEYRENLRDEQLFQIEKIIYDTSMSETQKTEKVLPLLKVFLEEYEGSEQASLSLFYRSGLYFAQKEYIKAETDLKGLLTLLEPGSDLFFLASLNLSNVLRDQNKADEAIEVLQSAKLDAMTDIILMEQAELFMSIENKEKAKDLLKILMKDYPNSFYATKAKQLLEIL
jgi:predicted negative regulator of RcsB-dependent stress response